MDRYAIYYFSATGNSLAVARCLADILKAPEPISIPGSLVLGDPYSVARGATKVGFVFPVHRATLPEMVRGFISKMPIRGNCYYFAVSTYTLFGCNEFLDIDDILNSKGAMLNYTATVRMMGNVGLLDPSERTVSLRIEQMQVRLRDIAEDIVNSQDDYTHPSLRVLGGVVNRFTDIRKKNMAFKIGKQCTRCGVCALVCPAQNIRLDTASSDALPTRSDKCEACMACIHWCPVKAISTHTPIHVKYHNPQVVPEDLSIGGDENASAT